MAESNTIFNRHFTSAPVNLAAATANQELIAAPGANRQIWVYGFAGTANEAGSVSIQDEDDVAHTGVMPVGATGGGFVLPLASNKDMPWFKVATNKALECDTLTCEFDGIITYRTVTVP